jgi:5'-deoxynucleotidase YfbR-like HD superfamily hydrolase
VSQDLDLTPEQQTEAARQAVRHEARRHGGRVQRCHTVPHHGSYSVAEHTYGAVQMVLTFHPNPSIDLVRAVMDHDVPEYWVGDIPSTAKMMSPMLARELQVVEDTVFDHYELGAGLTQEERRWLKAVDLLELWVWSHEQDALGNSYARLITREINAYIQSRPEMLPAPLEEFYLRYRWRHLPQTAMV